MTFWIPGRLTLMICTPFFANRELVDSWMGLDPSVLNVGGLVGGCRCGAAVGPPNSFISDFKVSFVPLNSVDAFNIGILTFLIDDAAWIPLVESPPGCCG